MLIDSGLPIVGYKFAVTIFTTGIPNSIDIYFKEVTGLKMDRTINYEGNRISPAKEKKVKTLTLKRGVFTAPSPLVVEHLAEANYWNSHLVRKDLLITVMDESGIPVNSWTVKRAFLESWEWDGVNAESKDVMIETMSFSFRDIAFEPIKQVRTGV